MDSKAMQKNKSGVFPDLGKRLNFFVDKTHIYVNIYLNTAIVEDAGDTRHQV